MSSNEIPFAPGSSVVGYVRDSGGEEQELSVAEQENALQKWCIEHQLTISRVYRDAARPGSSTVSRPAFLEMMADFKDPSCIEKGVIIWKFSRLSRDFDDATYFKSMLRHLGFTIYSITDNIPDTPEGRVFETMIDWMNHRYLEDLATDIKRGLNHIVTEYGAVPGTPPPGFMRSTKVIGTRRDGKPHTISHWVIDPDKAPIVRAAWKMRAGGATAREIHEKYHIYKNKAEYSRFFRNQLYIGDLVYGGAMIKKYAAPIVDKETWDKVQELNDANKVANHPVKGGENPNHPRRNGGSFLLSGLLYCERCGSIMNGKVVEFGGKKANSYYFCTGAKRRMDCDAKSIPSEALENTVIEQIVNFVQDPALFSNREKERETQQQERKSEREAQIKQLEKDVATLSRRISNLNLRLADEENPPKSTIQTIRQMESDLKAAQGNLDILNSVDLTSDVHLRTPEDLAAMADKMLEVLTSDDPLQKRTFVKLLVYRVTAQLRVDGDKAFINGSTYFYDDPDDKHDQDDPVKKNNPLTYGATPSRDITHRHKLYSLSWNTRIR